MKEKKNSLWLYIILVLLLVVIGIGIGYYFYSKYNNKVNEKSDNNETKNNQLYERTEAEKSIGLEYPYVIQKEIK